MRTVAAAKPDLYLGVSAPVKSSNQNALTAMIFVVEYGDVGAVAAAFLQSIKIIFIDNVVDHGRTELYDGGRIGQLLAARLERYDFAATLVVEVDNPVGKVNEAIRKSNIFAFLHKHHSL